MISGSDCISSTLKGTEQTLKIHAGHVILSDERAVNGTLKGGGELGELFGGDLKGDHGGCLN